MIIGIDANEANVINRVGSNQFAFKILKQLYLLDKKNTFRIYLKEAPLSDMPPSSKNWQYIILTPKFFWTQWRLPLSLFFKTPRPNIFLTLGHYSPRFSPVPTLIAIMDLAFIKYPGQFLKKDLQKLTSWTKYSALKAKHIFTISSATKKDIQNYYQINPEKITVTYPAIDTRQSLTKSPVFGKYLLYLGTLQPRKNLENLVKAFSQIISTYPDLKLVIVGKKGWLYQSLFNTVKNLSLEKKVIFLGFVPDPKVNYLIKKAKLLVLPSLYEGFGIPVVQAMSLGTPVLVSKNSSLKEIVQKNGYYINSPFDAEQIKQGIITALTDTDAKREIIIKKAKERSQDFSWKSSAKKILEVINEITA